MTEVTKTNLFLVVLFVGLFGYAFSGFVTLGLLAYGDLPALPMTTEDAMKFYFSAWLPMSQGFFFQQGFVHLFRAILVFVCRDNFILAQKLYLLIPLPIGFLTMYLFLSRYVKSRFARFVSSFLFIVNPMTIGTVIGGGTGMLYVFALLPLEIVFLFNMLKKENRFRNTLLFAMSFSIAFMFGIQAIILISPFVLYTVIKPFLAKNKSFQKSLMRALRNLRFLLIAGGIIAVLMSQYIFDYFGWFMKYSPVGAREGLREAELVTTQSLYSHPRAPNIAFILYLIGQWHSSIIGWGEDPVLLVAGLLWPIFAFSSLLVSTEKQKRVVYGFSFFAISIILFVYLTALGPGLWLFRVLPFMISWPNLANPEFLILFSYAVLISVTLDKLQVTRVSLSKISYSTNKGILTVRMPKMLPKTVASIVVGGLLVSSILICDWPFFTGHMGPSFEGDRLEDKIVPEKYYEVSNWLNQHSSGSLYRTLWMPFNFHTESDLRFIDPNMLVTPGGASMRAPSVLSYVLYNKFVLETFVKGTTTHLGNLLSVLNVKYVIADLTSNEKGFPYVGGYSYTHGHPSGYVNLLKRQQDLTLVYNSTNFLIYENLDYTPHFATYNPEWFVMLPPPANQTEAETYLDFLTLLYRIPSFDINNQVIVFGDQLTSDQKDLFMRASDVAIVYPNSFFDVKEYVNETQKLAFVYPITWKPSEVVFEDDFGVDLGLWSNVTGVWSVANEEMIQGQVTGIPYPHRAIAVSGNASWRDYVVEGDVRISDAEGGAGFAVRYLDKYNYYEVWLRAPSTVVLRKNFQGANDLVADGTTKIDVNGAYHLQAVVSGSSIKVFVDGELLIDAVDTSLSKGKVGVITYQSRAHFDNLKVTQVKYEVKDFLVPIKGTYKVALCAVGGGYADLEVNDIQHLLATEQIIVPGEVVFEDDFGVGLGLWSNVTGVWSVANEEMIQGQVTGIPYPHRAIAVSGNASWLDYVVEGDVRISDAEGGAGFAVRYSDKNNYYEIWLRAPSSVVLRKNVQGDNTQVTWTSMGIDVNRTYHLQTLVSGSSIKVFVDGELLIDAVDTSLSKGKVGVITYQSRAHFDNIKVMGGGKTEYIHSEWEVQQQEGLNLSSVEERSRLKWFVLKQPINLSQGLNKFTIPYSDLSIEDKLLIYPTDENSSLRDFFNMPKESRPNISWQMIGQNEYSVEVVSDQPVFLIFGEPYHPDWNAYVDGDKLPHFPAYSFLNAFYIEKPGSHIRIVYDQQKTRDQMLFAWHAIWTVAIIGIIYTSRNDMSKLYSFVKKCLHQPTENKRTLTLRKGKTNRSD